MIKIRNVILLITLLSPLHLLANPPFSYDGMKLYISYCQLCHGPIGKGDGVLAKSMNLNLTSLVDRTKSMTDSSLENFFYKKDKGGIKDKTTEDIHSNSIINWEKVFAPSDIKSIIAYIRFIENNKYPLIGDPKIGSNIYQQYCHVCHGVSGKGDGVLTELMGAKAMNHTNISIINQYNNQHLTQSIIHGKGKYMPAWGGVLTDSEVEGLVSYIRLLSYHQGIQK